MSMGKLKCVGVTGHYANDDAKKRALDVMKMLKKKGVKAEVDLGFSLGSGGKPLNDINCDLLLCFGGDGSILHAVRNHKREIPIMGINCGSKGHLTELHCNDFRKRLDDIVNAKFRLEKKTRLQVENFQKIPPALNEITLATAKAGMLMEYDLYINGKFVWKDSADGVIVATATGSTAYALSAGGSVVHDNAGVLTIVPLNSNDTGKRSLVVDEDATVELKNYSHEINCEVIVDGQIRVPVEAELRIKKAKPAIFARLD